MATLVSLQLSFAGGVGVYHATSYSASGDRSRVAVNDRPSYGTGSKIASYPKGGHIQGGGALCCPLRSHPTIFKNNARVRAACLPTITSSVLPLPMELELKPIVVMFVNYGGHFLRRTAALFQMCPPLLAEVAPAVGLVTYAIWVLSPTTRIFRKLVFKRNDKKWEESRTYNIMASYMRPILLWIGIILICRALDPVMLSTEASQAIKQRFVNFIRSLSTVLAFAFCTASLTQQVQRFMMENQDAEESRTVGVQFVGNTVYTSVWVAAVCLFMELLGFSTQKWITAGGFGTVLITLAGREIFTNFLSSIMIHATRPFVDNEWIQTKIEGQEVSGTVEHVGWWSPTVIRGDDREAVHIPNHKFSVSVVRNLSQKTHWRIKTHLGISHLDFSKIRPIVADMRKVLAKHPQVEQQRLHRRVFFDQIDPENQALMILISCFVKTSHFEEYLRVKEIILLDLLKVIGHHGARLATPIRSVQRVLDEAESRGSPFRDVRNSNQSQQRPFLLLESQVASSDDEEDDEDDILDTISRLSEQLAKVGKAAAAFSDNVESVSDLKSASIKLKEVAVDGSAQSLEKPTSSDDESLPQENSANSENLMDRIYAGTEETLVKPHITDIGPSSLNQVQEKVKGATISEERVVVLPDERIPQLYSNNVGLDDSPLLDGEMRASSVKFSVNVHKDQIVETTEDQQVHIDKHVEICGTLSKSPFSIDPWKQPPTLERDGEEALEASYSDHVTINDESHVLVPENVRDKHVGVRVAFESSGIDDPWKQHLSEEPLDSPSDLWRESSSSQAASNRQDLWSQPSARKVATVRPVDTKLIPGVAIEGPKHTLPLEEDVDEPPTLVGPGKSKEGAAAVTGAIPNVFHLWHAGIRYIPPVWMGDATAMESSRSGDEDDAG